jgi:hypothetical protein
MEKDLELGEGQLMKDRLANNAGMATAKEKGHDIQ